MGDSISKLLAFLTFHNIALDLQLSAHKQGLCFRLAGNQLAEILIT